MKVNAFELSGAGRMKGEFKTRSFLCLRVVFLFLIAGTFFSVSAESTRVQTFLLEEGWNAVYLAVDPVESDPDILFVDHPIDVVSAFDDTTFTQQFTTDKNVNLLKNLGWGTWYSPDREDAFLSELGSIYGQKAYLVHATEACTLPILGTVSVQSLRWNADAYNLVGFTLDALAPPTFETFFAGSEAFNESSIYCLENGIWKKVVDPANRSMKSGEAFWIFAEGSSAYQGPLSVSVGARGVINLAQNEMQDVVLKNASPYPLSPRVEHWVSSEEPLPLSIAVKVVGGVGEGIEDVPADLGDTSWEVDLPAINAGAGLKIPLILQADRMTRAEGTSLLCIKSDLGTETWVSVTGVREDLK